MRRHGWGGSCHGRWGHHHSNGSALGGVLVLGFMFVMAVGSAVASWLNTHASRFFWVIVLGAMLALSVWVVVRTLRAAVPPAPSTAPDRLADVTGLRVALDASIAPTLVGALRRALSLPERDRLASIAELLLDARPQWRLAAFDATRPLPEPKARKLFEAWADDVRVRFAPRGSLPPGDPFRASPLLVVCLHVETIEEIPDVSHADPDAVEKTLSYLRARPLSVRQVDLWSSSEPLEASALTAIDGTMRSLA